MELLAMTGCRFLIEERLALWGYSQRYLGEGGHIARHEEIVEFVV
jgi:hypothetical protein